MNIFAQAINMSRKFVNSFKPFSEPSLQHLYRLGLHHMPEN